MNHPRVIHEFLFKLANNLVAQSFNRFKDSGQLRYFKKVVILRAIDSAWIDQLDYLQQLKSLVDGRTMAQHKPLNEFGKEARRRFFEMEDEIFIAIFRSISLSELKVQVDGSIDIEFP